MGLRSDTHRCLARGGAKNSFPFCVLRPPVFLICQHPFSAKHRSLSLPKQALSKSTHVLINHAKVQRKVHESEDAACPSTLPHEFSVKERLQFVELGAHDEGDSHEPAHRRSYGCHVLTFFLS